MQRRAPRLDGERAAVALDGRREAAAPMMDLSQAMQRQNMAGLQGQDPLEGLGRGLFLAEAALRRAMARELAAQRRGGSVDSVR